MRNLRLQRNIVIAITATVAFVANNFCNAAEPEQRYPIKLFREANTGEKYELQAKETHKQLVIVSKDGKTLQTKSEFKVTIFKGEVTILKVDKKGNATAKSVAVESLLDGKKNEILKRGQIVIVELIEGKTVYRLKKGQLTKSARDRLASILKMKAKKELSDDNIFGTKKPHAIGESWAIQPAGFAAELKVDQKTVSGKVKIVKQNSIQGTECLQIAGEVKINSFPNAQDITKGGYRLVNPSVFATFSGDFPIDLKKAVLTHNMSMTAQTTMIGVKPELKGITIKFSTHSIREQQRRYLKKQ